MQSNLKPTLIKILKLVVILLIVDFCLGSITKHIFFTQKTGKFARSTYVINNAKEEVIIFGSSHAHRNYVPEVIQNSMNKTCYNAGAEGQQLLFHRALQKMLFKRNLPEIIILNIDENFLYKSDIAHNRLSDLHPYYPEFKEELRPILSLKSNFIDFKLFFKSYQTNSTLIHAVRYYLAPQIAYNGYRPLDGVMAKNEGVLTINDDSDKEYIEEIDEAFVMTLKDFIRDAKSKGVKLFLVTSPNLVPRNTIKNKSLEKIKAMANIENIPFIDFLNSNEFLNEYDLFHDPSHLNDKGARLFTLKLSEILKLENLPLTDKILK